MVSQRCEIVVKEVLNNIGVKRAVVRLGQVLILDNISQKQIDIFKDNLQKVGLELIENNKNILTEKIKNVIVEMIHYYNEMPKVNYSLYISQKLNHDYTYLSNIFSEVGGITIQQFIIKHKIEKVKELLMYDEMNLTEISYKMHYSSVAHLSNQFKKVTGHCPSYFKESKQCRLGYLENV